MNFYHLILLDASGSMNCIRQTALTGCNETLQSIRAMQHNHADQQHFVSLVSFNSEDPARIILDCRPAGGTTDLPANAYLPNACTPLYDAVGIAIARMERALPATDCCVLVTIITDGLENASIEYNAASLKRLVEQKKKQNWTFAFIGANQDEVMEAGRIGIRNTLRFDQNERGTRKMFSRLGTAMERFCKEAPVMTREERETGFFRS
ncbi:MAG: VWA domain-containing protein [Paludibacteraceae bacterium]|nr:VWA domain-containing protein [Paludibacteraceae bacterium]